MAYEWKENMACRATWTILTSPKFMNQFKGEFVASKGKTMGEMRYWPNIAMKPEVMEGIAWAMGQRFIAHLVATYTKKKQNKMDESADIIQKVADVFRKNTATVTDLAEVVDSVALFPDEK